MKPESNIFIILKNCKFKNNGTLSNTQNAWNLTSITFI